MYKAVVFDLDGTLVNSLYDLASSMNKALAACGLPVYPADAYRQFVGNGRTVLVERAVGGERLTPEIKARVIDLFDKDYAAHCMDKTRPYEGIREMLDALNAAGVKTGVLSNKPDEFVKEIIGRLFPGFPFTLAWGKKPQFKEKPDSGALFAMLDEMGVSSGECLYVGDSNVDVYTAENAGLPFCGVEWGFRGKRELIGAGAAATVKTARELLLFIKEGDEG